MGSQSQLDLIFKHWVASDSSVKNGEVNLQKMELIIKLWKLKPQKWSQPSLGNNQRTYVYWFDTAAALSFRLGQCCWSSAWKTIVSFRFQNQDQNMCFFVVHPQKNMQTIWLCKVGITETGFQSNWTFIWHILCIYILIQYLMWTLQYPYGDITNNKYWTIQWTSSSNSEAMNFAKDCHNLGLDARTGDR